MNKIVDIFVCQSKLKMRIRLIIYIVLTSTFISCQNNTVVLNNKKNDDLNRLFFYKEKCNTTAFQEKLNELLHHFKNNQIYVVQGHRFKSRICNNFKTKLCNSKSYSRVKQ